MPKERESLVLHVIVPETDVVRLPERVSFVRDTVAELSLLTELVPDAGGDELFDLVSLEVPVRLSDIDRDIVMSEVDEADAVGSAEDVFDTLIVGVASDLVFETLVETVWNNEME